MNDIKISVFGKEEIYKILEVLEFDSDRKRMSIIVKDSNNKIIVYTKGADSILWDLMKESEFQKQTDENLRVKNQLSFLIIRFLLKKVFELYYVVEVRLMKKIGKLFQKK